jgi:ribosomal-protein-alanine N-acetyltransferase
MTIDRVAFTAEEQYGDEMYRLMLDSGRSVVAVDDSEVIVGYAFVQITRRTHVRSIAVHPDFQRRGFGRALLQAVIANAGHDVDLLVDETNRPAITLYRQLGFQPAEICPTVPPKRRMVLDVNLGATRRRRRD